MKTINVVNEDFTTVWNSVFQKLIKSLEVNLFKITQCFDNVSYLIMH
jgi:hypothetical protein